MTGGPVQDIWDQQLANIADTFLGIAHQNCLLCHNGAGHLTTLSLWGGQQTRVSAWGMAAFHGAHLYATARRLLRGSDEPALLDCDGQFSEIHRPLPAEYHDGQPPAAPAHRHA